MQRISFICCVVTTVLVVDQNRFLSFRPDLHQQRHVQERLFSVVTDSLFVSCKAPVQETLTILRCAQEPYSLLSDTSNNSRNKTKSEKVDTAEGPQETRFLEYFPHCFTASSEMSPSNSILLIRCSNTDWQILEPLSAVKAVKREGVEVRLAFRFA